MEKNTAIGVKQLKWKQLKWRKMVSATTLHFPTIYLCGKGLGIETPALRTRLRLRERAGPGYMGKKLGLSTWRQPGGTGV